MKYLKLDLYAPKTNGKTFGIGNGRKCVRKVIGMTRVSMILLYVTPFFVIFSTAFGPKIYPTKYIMLELNVVIIETVRTNRMELVPFVDT